MGPYLEYIRNLILTPKMDPKNGPKTGPQNAHFCVPVLVEKWTRKLDPKTGPQNWIPKLDPKN